MAWKPIRTASAAAAAAALAVGLAGPASAQAVMAVDATATVQLPGSLPAWAATGTRDAGPPASAVRHIDVALALRDPAGAQRLATEIATPGPRRLKPLTRDEFLARFGPTSATVSAVSAWLRGEGLTVTGVAANRHFVEATGTTAALNKAFGVSLGSVKVGAHQLVAPDRPLSLPRSLAGAVSAVLGLDDSAALDTPHQVSPLTAARTTSGPGHPATGAAAARPADSTDCAQWWGQSNNSTAPQQFPDQSNALCGYSGPQTRAVYGLSAAATGQGVRVAAVGAYDDAHLGNDIQQWASKMDVPLLHANQYYEATPIGGFNLNNPACTDWGRSPTFWTSEQALDLESIHAMAPAATMTWYAASDCTQIEAMLNAAVAADTDQIISNSWSNPFPTPDEITQVNAVLIEAAIQGQTLLFASGDDGDDSGIPGSTGPRTEFPASDPWATAVGGTTAALDGANHLLWTTGWEDTGEAQTGSSWTPVQGRDSSAFLGGGGGGVSSFDEPTYQHGVVPDAIAGGHRTVPDISALGNSITGMWWGYSGSDGWVGGPAGGTSEATPQVAGLVADAIQVHGVAPGFLNPWLYQVEASTPGALTAVGPHRTGAWLPSLSLGDDTNTPPGSYLEVVDADSQSLRAGAGWSSDGGLGMPGPLFGTGSTSSSTTASSIATTAGPAR